MSEKRAFLFPGQGAQFVGMGKSLLEVSPRARDLVLRGSRALDLDLAELVLEGPLETLNSTRVSQPAIFLLSMIALDFLGERLGSEKPFAGSLSAGATAGLSLGEYSALVFAGCLDFDEALDLVVARGEFMQDACDEVPGTMASILGLPAEEVEKIVSEAGPADRLAVANYNSPVQTVISGGREEVEKGCELAKERGARRVVPLKVAGAYHSALMASATKKLAPILEKVTLRPSRCPFYSNVSGGRVDDPEEIRIGLIQQVESAVQWVSIVNNLSGCCTDGALEIGPGRVIAGLVRSIDKDLRVTSLGEMESIEEFCAAASTRRVNQNVER